jgi:hypothetical protein
MIKQLSFFVLLAALFGLGFAQGAPDGVPVNAYAEISGNGWQCDQRCREDRDPRLADASRDHTRQTPCCGGTSGKVADTAKLVQEIARLKAQVSALSLQNAVLRSQYDDDR